MQAAWRRASVQRVEQNGGRAAWSHMLGGGVVPHTAHSYYVPCMCRPRPSSWLTDCHTCIYLPKLQVAIYGMNPKIGLLSFPPEENQLHKPYRWAVGRWAGRLPSCIAALRWHCAKASSLHQRSGLCSTLSSAEAAAVHVLTGSIICLSHCAVTTLPA